MCSVRGISLVALLILMGCASPRSRSESAIGGVSTIAPSSAAAAPQVARGAPTTARVLPASYNAVSETPAPPDAADAHRSDSAGERAPRSLVPAGALLGVPGAAAPERAPPAFPSPAEPWSDPLDPFAGSAALTVEPLVAAVQSRNPSLQAATAAWRAAAERYPQEVSLADPMFESMVSPRGVGTMDGGGWMVQASQAVPWPGKRQLRGAAASAEADAMRGDIGDTRLRLAEAARMSFYDYYLAERLAEVNAATQSLLVQFRKIAATKYQVGQATEQDVLQTDVELASVQTRATELRRNQQVARARINTLLHRPPECLLPPPPAALAVVDSLPDAVALQEAAARLRPDLFAQCARIRAEEANLELACKEYYPDVDLRARYDGFMPEDMRAQVGVALNVPIQRARRSAAVREAEDRIQQRRWEYQNLLDEVRYEVQSARDRAAQAREAVALYEAQTLPASRRNLESAQANYTSGKLDFLRLIDAERQLNAQCEMYHQAVAEYHQRLAELERAVGAPLWQSP